MGFRFRKSINLGPARINLSKSGIGGSLGVKGARITKSSNGKVRKTLSIPGTGLSYVTEKGKKKTVASKTANSEVYSAPKKSILHIILGILLFPVTVPFLIYKSEKFNKISKVVAITAWIIFLFYVSK